MQELAAELSLDLQEILLRLFLSMAIGMIVGGERTRTHRPAGMRTHMLVALGSCIVMMTSQMIFSEYRPLGATPDPARLPAQIINGIGFLGAGTIIKEGFTIKGLTTAASLWTVACLGISCGGGYYNVALGGAIAVYITLTLVDILQKKMPTSRDTVLLLSMGCTDLSDAMVAIDGLAERMHVSLTNMHFEKQEGAEKYAVLARATFSGAMQEQEITHFINRLKQLDDIQNVDARQL